MGAIEEEEKIIVKETRRKILGAKFCSWANFPCFFFQKIFSPIVIFSKNDLSKFYRENLFYLKIL